MITFRQIVRYDISALSESFRAAVGGSDAFQACLAADQAGVWACHNDTPIGFAIADGKRGELRMIAVLPGFERRGIGKELLKQAEAWLFSHGWAEIRIVIADGEHAQSVDFFRHLGWGEGKAGAGRHFLKKANPGSGIKLEEHVIEDALTGYSRRLRLQRGPSGQPHRVCLFLDGEHYWRDMDAIPILNDLIDRRILPSMTIALVGHVSGAARHEDYTCNEAYARFIGDTVMPWLKDEISGVQENGHIICGLSLSGLMAVYLSLQYPQHFDYCLSQSGSHWWRHEWFAGFAREKGRTDSRFWMSVGDQETQTNVKHSPTGLLQEISQVAGVTEAAQILEAIGGTVYYNTLSGGHSIRCWREELGDALRWLASEDVRNQANGRSS